MFELPPPRILQLFQGTRPGYVGIHQCTDYRLATAWGSSRRAGRSARSARLIWWRLRGSLNGTHFGGRISLAWSVFFKDFLSINRALLELAIFIIPSFSHEIFEHHQVVIDSKIRHAHLYAPLPKGRSAKG